MTIKKNDGVFKNVVFLQRRVKESILEPIHAKKQVRKTNDNDASNANSGKIEVKNIRKKLKKLNNIY